MTLVTRQAMTDDGGTFTTGTVVDEAFVDQVYGQIDDQAHSATNPTRKPKDTTDEVVAARGSKASLDARLDVSLEEDGTLKTQASLVTAAQVQSALGGRNVAVNGDLDDWSGGGAAAPDSFTLAGAAATIARTGIAQADTFHFGTGSGFAAKVTRAGTNWTLTQDVIAAADFAKYVNVKSQKVSAAVKGKTGIASHLRIVIDDGVTTTASSFHTGGNTEEHLSVTHTISGTATKLSVYVEGLSSNGDAYVGGFNIVFADLAPSDWAPLSLTPDANATRRGLVSAGAQAIGGDKTLSGAFVNSSTTPAIFNATPTFKPGGSATVDAKANGRTFTDTTTVGNVGAGEDDLMTTTLSANTLNANGKAVRVTAWGEFSAAATTKTLKLFLGSDSITIYAATNASTLGQWLVTVIIVRVGAASQKVVCSIAGDSGSITAHNAIANFTRDETTALTLKFTGQDSGSNNDGVTQQGMIVEVVG